MKNLTTHFFAIAMGLASLSSCKKEETITPSTSKADLLTAKIWKMTDITVVENNLSFYVAFDACRQDNLTKFNSDRSITYDENTLKCNPSDPQTNTGSWELTANETKLKVTDSDGVVVEAIINTLTSTTLTITDPSAMGNDKAAQLTFTAQ